MKDNNEKLVWFIDHPSARVWSINPYKKCSIRCVYCIAQSQGEAEPWFGANRVVEELKNCLADIPQDCELFVGALVDAYPLEEKMLGLTRMVLRELSRQTRPFCINTKSCLVLRDMDILVQHQGHCDVFMSLCSLDQGILSRLEFNASSVTDRLRAVSNLNEAGVEVAIDAAPWIPGVSDIRTLLDALPAGVSIQVAPLDIRHVGSEATFAGIPLSQQQINDAYEKHKISIGNNPRIKWKNPVP